MNAWEYVNPFVSALIGIGPPAGWISAAAATVAFVGVRAYLNRKRLTFEEVYNAKVGIVPPFNPNGPAHPPEAGAIDLRTFTHVTIIVIRVRNTGPAAIGRNDFAQTLRVAVTGRHIIDFRVSGLTPAGTTVERGIDTGLLDSDGKPTGWVVSAPTGDLNNIGDGACTDRTTLRADLPRAMSDGLTKD